MYVQNDTLLLVDVFENFQSMCLEIYELVRFPTAPKLACLGALKKTKGKLDLLIDIIMLLMAEKDFRGAISGAIYRYAKVMIKIETL